MPQKFFEDIIGTLSHNAGVISLNPSRLTIGGQQYATAILTRTISADVTMTANSLYMIFAVVSGGVVSLRISSNFNSVGPSGFNAWKLVGAFYANAGTSVGFGSFVTIEGVPSTYNEISESGSTQLNALYAGFSAFTPTLYHWSRVGKSLFINWRLDSVSGTAANARIPLPRGGISIVENSTNIGTFAGQNAASNAGGGSIIALGTEMGFGGPNLTASAISTSSGTAVTGTGPTTLVGQLRAHAVNWSATPLKDL